MLCLNVRLEKQSQGAPSLNKEREVGGGNNEVESKAKKIAPHDSRASGAVIKAQDTYCQTRPPRAIGGGADIDAGRQMNKDEKE